MPSSGARSGTKPSRSMRGAGDGRVGRVIRLACGHDTTSLTPVAVFPGRRRFYRCPTERCGLQEPARR